MIAEQCPARTGMCMRTLERDDGIKQDEKIWPRPVILKKRASTRGEMSARRRAEHAEPVQSDAEFQRPRPHEPDRVLHILQGSRMSRSRHAVAQHKRRHPETIEPAGDVRSFVFDCEHLVA